MTAISNRLVRPPMDGVRRAPFAVRSAADDERSDGLTLDGFAAVFNRPTVIDSYEGRFREQIAPGSMKKSFRERPPIVQFDHGRHQSIGSFPIAMMEPGYPREESDPELAPDGGAHVVARMFADPMLGLLREALTAGAINGMSFRFSVVRESWESADGRALRSDQDLMRELERTYDADEDALVMRTLREVKVAEVGPVVWPAYADTSVGLRSKFLDLGRLATGDPEQLDLLGRAIFIANTARNQEDDAPQSTGRPAGEHPSEAEDAPQSTDRSAGEHPSTERKPLSFMELKLRNQRGWLLNHH